MTPVLNAVGIVTSEMARSLEFYRQLGLDVPDTPEEGHVNIDIADGIRLMIDSEAEVRKFRPDWDRKMGNQLALAFQCESPSQVDEVYARMTTAGFQGDKEPWNAFWGQRYAQLRDPDGVPVDLYATI
jgi:uncharacterized glyoxalase superfamily protein PhnB